MPVRSSSVLNEILPTEEDNLAQLRRAVQHEVDASNADNNGTNTATSISATRNGSTTPATDGARKPAAVGSDYASLRLLTRRQPKDPGAVLQGVDTSNLDLSWTAKEGPENLDPNGQPWRYPKKKGKNEGSNLDEFKEDITERTKNGQGCKAIAEAYIAMGVDTSVRAVARQRMKWGLRQRAKRKMTEQGLANIRKAHLEQAKRLANSDPVPVKRVRIRVMRKAEITRMTKEGMTAAQIAANLTARGVKLSRGAATVERLRTVWGLTEDTQRSVNNIRATARNHATRAQKEQFENIARELEIEDVDAWVKSKMEEEVAQDARREYAYKLMGDARPKPQSVEQTRRNTQHLKALKEDRQNRGNVLTRMPGVDYVPETLNAAFTPVQREHGDSSTPAESLIAAAPSDEDDSELEEMDCAGADIGDAGGAEEAEETEFADGSGVAGDDQYSTSQGSREATQQPPVAIDVDSLFPLQSSQTHGTKGVYLLSSGQPLPASMPAPAPNVTNMNGDASLNHAGFYEQYGNSGPPQSAVNRGSDTPSVRTAPPAGMPGRPSAPAFAHIAPRPLSMAPPRAITPRPCAPQQPPFRPAQKEIEEMATFGLTPYPCPGKPPQKYLTPKGMITTEGYEYLATPPPHPGASYGHPVGSLPSPLNVVEQQAPPSATTRIWSVVPVVPPPPPKVSQVPQPPVVIAAEEMQKYTVEVRLLEGYHKTSQECLDTLAARANCRPVPHSLTGLPPSLKDVQLAKERLREAANALLVEL
ncbi:unnamed protein product [Discula destructiva]